MTLKNGMTLPFFSEEKRKLLMFARKAPPCFELYCPCVIIFNGKFL